MTHQPLDLDAVLERYKQANTTPPAEIGETMQEWRDRVDLELAGRAFDSSDDVPDLVAEIQNLRDAEPDGGWRALAQQQIRELVAKDNLIRVLEEASAQDQAEIERLQRMLHPTSVNRDPDWYIEQCAADKAFHQMGDQP